MTENQCSARARRSVRVNEALSPVLPPMKAVVTPFLRRWAAWDSMGSRLSEPSVWKGVWVAQMRPWRGAWGFMGGRMDQSWSG